MYKTIRFPFALDRGHVSWPIEIARRLKVEDGKIIINVESHRLELTVFIPGSMVVYLCCVNNSGWFFL